MATTPEGKVKKEINRIIANYGTRIYRFMPVPSGYQSVTLDYLLCVNGYFVAIEAKRPGGKPTPLQNATIEEITRAGGVAIVVDGTNESLNNLNNLLFKLLTSNNENFKDFAEITMQAMQASKGKK